MIATQDQLVTILTITLKNVASNKLMKDLEFAVVFALPNLFYN